MKTLSIAGANPEALVRCLNRFRAPLGKPGIPAIFQIDHANSASLTAQPPRTP